MKLDKCPGWSGLGTQVILLVLSCPGSFRIFRCKLAQIGAMSSQNLSLEFGNQLRLTLGSKEDTMLYPNRHTNGTILAANNKGTDKTVQMCRLIYVFVVSM